MQRINRSLFQRAESVVALTDEMREYLLDHRPELSANRVVTISNWAHEATAGSKSATRAELGYTDEDFIVAYFGNIGICQDETALIQAMNQLEDHKNIKFLIAGHGNKMPSVRQAAERLPNVRICDFLTGAAFEHAVAASSCGIVSLEQGLIGMCGKWGAAHPEYLAIVSKPGTVQKNVRQCSETIHGKVCKGHQSEQVYRLAQERITHSQLRNCFS